MKDDCISINFKQTADPVGMHLCELNDADMIQHPADIKDTHEFSYQGAKVRCAGIGLSLRVSSPEYSKQEK